MTLVIPAGFSQVAWRWELNGDPEYLFVTCGIQNAVGGGDFDAGVEAASDAMLAAWPAAGMSNQFRFRGAVGRFGAAAPPYAVFEHQENVVGVGGSNVLPQNCALLARKLTNSAGRRNRGRFYFPMLSVIETAVDQIGAISPESLTDLQGRLNTLYAGLVAAGLPPFLLHSNTPTQVTATPAPTAITSFAAEPRIATMRRRMRR